MEIYCQPMGISCQLERENLDPFLLRDVYDPDEHTQVSNKSYSVEENEFQYLPWTQIKKFITSFQNYAFFCDQLHFQFQRWRLLLTLSLVNIFYIICGFLLNFKVHTFCKNNIDSLSSKWLLLNSQIVRIKQMVIICCHRNIW